MIPLIQKEIESHGWLSASQFVDIIAISEMTPGPVAVNSATFVGYKVAGVLGGIVATFGVALPSVVLILIVSRYFFRFQDHPLNKMIFYGIRPIVVGLIFSAAIFVAQTAFIKEGATLFSIIDFKSVIIFLVTLICLIKFKINPIVMIIIAGILGVVLAF